MDNVYGAYTPEAYAFDDEGLSVTFTVGKLDKVNRNGWVLAKGILGGEEQMAKLSKYNHHLGPWSGDSDPPVGVIRYFETKTELRGEARYNPSNPSAVEAYNSVKFNYDNGAPDDWSYGARPIEVDYGEEGDPPRFTLAEFFEGSPVLRGAHEDSRTLKADESAKEGSMAPKAQPEPKAEPVPTYTFDATELAARIGDTVAEQLQAMRVDADKFAALEKQNLELRNRLKILEDTPAPEIVTAGSPSIAEVWAAGNHKWEEIHAQARGSGVYTAHLDIDPRTLWAADVTTSSGVTGLPERVGYDFTALGRLRLMPFIPTLPTSASSIRFQRETINTANRPAATTEAAASPEANISYADQDRPVQTIRGLIPITEEELEDVPFMEALISERMSALAESALQAQILEGTGTAPQLTGINDTTNVQTATATYAADNDTRAKNMIDAIASIASDIESNTDVGQTDLVAMTPAHFWIIAAAKDGQDRPLFAGWEGGVPRSVFGIALVPTGGQDAAKQTAISRAHLELRVRRGLTVEIGLNDDDFSKFKRSVRVSIRAALAVRRPQGMGVIAAANS